MGWTSTGVQSGTDTSLASITSVTGVTVNTSATGMLVYTVPASVTLLTITGSLSWDPDFECLLLSDSTRVEQNTGSSVTIGVESTVNGKVRYSRGTGLIMNRVTIISANLNAANWWGKNGCNFITYGGQIKTAGAIFFGSTTNPTGQSCTLSINGNTDFMNTNGSTNLHCLRLFLEPAGVNINSSTLSGRAFASIPFSSLGFNNLSVNADFASFQSDGNGLRDPVTVTNPEFVANKSDRDYSYITKSDSIVYINKYIFKNADVGSALRTAGAVPSARRQGVAEITKEVSFSIADLSSTAISGAVTYMLTNGASLNPAAGSRYAGIDDYVTPRVYISDTDLTGVTDTQNILYAVAQGYDTTSATAAQPLTMDSLTTRANDVQDAFVWSYGHLLGRLTAPMRGTGPLQIDWTLFEDSSVTLSASEAEALTAIESLDDFYDAAKIWKTRPVRAQLEYPTIATQLTVAEGTQLNLGSLNLVVDGAASAAFEVNTGTNTITIKSSSLAMGSKFTGVKTTGLITTVNGASITAGYADANGVRVTIRSADGLTLSTRVLLDGSFIDAELVVAAERVITVQPTSAVRVYAHAYGYQPKIINVVGGDAASYVITLLPESVVDTTLDTTIRDTIVTSFGSGFDAFSRLFLSVNSDLRAYTPAQVINALHYYVVTEGGLLAAAALGANSVAGFSFIRGGVAIRSPGFYAKVADSVTSTDALGVLVPLSIYVDPSVYVAMPTYTPVELNTSNVVLQYAPWTQQEADVPAWVARQETVEAIGTPLQAGDYVVPPTVVDIQSGLATEANVNTRASQASVDAIPTTPLLAADYAAPDNAGITAIKAKTDTLVNGPALADIEASTVLAKESTVASRASQASVDAIPTTPLLAADYVAPPAVVDIQAGLATGAQVTALGTPLQAGDYTAPDNATIGQIKSKVDTLENTDTSSLPTLAQIEGSSVLAKESSVLAINDDLLLQNQQIINAGVKLASLSIPHNSNTNV